MIFPDFDHLVLYVLEGETGKVVRMSFTVGSWADLCLITIIPYLHLGASKTSRLDFCTWRCWMWHCVLSVRCGSKNKTTQQRVLKGQHGWCDEFITRVVSRKSKCGEAWCAAVYGVDPQRVGYKLATEQQQQNALYSLTGVMVGELGRAWTLNGDLLANSINHCFCRWAGDFWLQNS